MKTLVLIRGSAGSGKSTIARALIAAYYANKVGPDSMPYSYEADDFFTDKLGTYAWIPEKVPLAHADCLRRVNEAMVRGDELIIQSNTNLTYGRIAPYLELAKQHGYDVQQIIVFSPFKNEHNVPPERVEQMKGQLKASLVNEINSGVL